MASDFDGRHVRDEAEGRVAYAHSPNDTGQWDLLEVHLREVARLAQQFSAALGGTDLAYLAGLLHDLGKYSRAFQNYLVSAVDREGKNREADHEQDPEVAGKVDHSTAGAQHAMATLSTPANRLLAYLIAGHHSGLLDAGSVDSSDVPGTLAARLIKPIEPLDGVPEWLLEAQEVFPPELVWCQQRSAVAFQMAFFTRMLFSALVDADFLATEAHFKKEQVAQRNHRVVDWEVWRDRLDTVIQAKQKKTGVKCGQTKVFTQRKRIYDACCRAAADEPGFFSLTVPTGGGKTLSSLAMAIGTSSLIENNTDSDESSTPCPLRASLNKMLRSFVKPWGWTPI